MEFILRVLIIAVHVLGFVRAQRTAFTGYHSNAVGNGDISLLYEYIQKLEDKIITLRKENEQLKKQHVLTSKQSGSQW